jgi:hypothetical protein
MSPLLFGIFMDDFESHMRTTLGDEVAAWPILAGRLVPPLLFADDIFLLATTAAGLQAQLHALQTYCDAKHLTVNSAKTQVVILRPGGGGSARLAAGESFTYADTPLQVVQSCKYLGLTFTQLGKTRGFANCADTMALAGRKALFAMRRRAFELGASSVEQQCSLFDILVKPVLSYGCEIWGVDLLTQADGSTAPERVHSLFCRQVQGLPRQVPSALALAELGRMPLHLFWTQQLARYWNHLQTCMEDPDRLLGWALADNLDLMRQGLDCWARRWQRIMMSMPTESGTLVWLTQLDEGAVMERAEDAYASSCLQSAKFAYYLTCIRADLPLSEPAPHLSTVPTPTHRIALSRFRTSCHDLRIERERYVPQAIKAPRHERTCLQCAHPSAIENELHMVFHCPLYERLRFQYADLFPPDLPLTIQCFLSHDQKRVASFIHECSVLRRQHA